MDELITPAIFILITIGVVFLVIQSYFIVNQQSAGVVERFGRFNRIAEPGLNFLIPFIDTVRTHIQLRIMQLDVVIETKTLDNVFIKIVTSVQYRVLPNKIYEAFYMLSDPEDQIQAFVFDVVRAQVPKLLLDEVFSKKDDIAGAVTGELQGQMFDFGYEIIKALVTDIAPNEKVKEAMNEINTAQRMRMAAIERGEAEKILRVKQAEAEAESNILHGRGIAGQRKEIMEGLSMSVEEMTRQLPALTPKEVMDMVLLVQYFDMMKDIGGSSKSNVVFVPNTPQGLQDTNAQVRDALLTVKKLED